MVSVRKISVFGVGRVGLVTAACFASKGLQTVCFDVDDHIISVVNQGKAPFFEPTLSELVGSSVKAGFLIATTDFAEAVLGTDATFITVGTPSTKDGRIDLTHMKRACKMIGEALRRKSSWHLVITKSTVLPTTTETIVKPMLERISRKKCPDAFGVCVNPEFLREGSAVQDALRPDRIIIGELGKESGDALESLYRDFYGAQLPPTIRTTPANAELIKYANNAYLAVKISFINNVANLCQRIPGADIESVARGIGLDNRIGSLFLKAGLGWGGSCLPKDVRAISEFSKSLRTSVPVIDAAFHTNETQPTRAIHLAEQVLGSLKGKRVALLGLSFKPGTDDMRDAVSVKIVKGLLKKGAKVTAYDPYAMANAKRILGSKIQMCSSALDCINGAECCIVVTEWDEFKRMEPIEFKSRMKRPIVVDGRRILDPDRFAREVEYVAIGLGSMSPARA